MPADTGLAVITGASSGIGLVYADRLAARGHDLLLIARREDRLADLAERLRGQYGIAVRTEVADLAKTQDLARVEALVSALSPDLLINNAGIGGLGVSAALSVERIEDTILLNITALSRLSHVALAGFRARGRGGLVNIGSVIGHNPSSTAAAYSGSKAYVLNFTRSLQIEYADTDIRIQLVEPGPIHTEFFTSSGLTDAVFPEEVYLTAEQLVDAALAGFDAGELVTVPSLGDTAIWDRLEVARLAFMDAVRSGKVATRYLVQDSVNG